MPNLNKCHLIGRLTRDPELRYTPKGTAVADLGLAINRNYAKADGEKQEETVFLDVTAWDKMATTIGQYLHKGDPIYIEGRLTVDTWETRGGETRHKVKVVADGFQFLGGKRDDSPRTTEPAVTARQSAPANTQPEDDGDTIPF